MRGHVRWLVLAALGISAPAAMGMGGSRSEKGPARPSLKLRAFPGMAFPPVDVLLTAEWKGDGHADFHCPEVEWDFSDGSRSVYQEDCAPYTGESKPERRFARRHAYRAPGEYQAVVTLRQGDRVVARASTSIRIYGGGDAGASPYSASRQ